ncbi:MAG: 50S ribosomal protein L17 [Alkalispirochaeta sp.]
MKHKIGYNRLGRKTAHRKAMTRNMLTSLFRHERIRTTKAKALAVRRTAEKMITRAKLDSVHNRRIIGKDIKDSAVLAKMFTDIGPRFKERPGGYTRVLKLGPRASDAAEMVILELLPEEEKPAAKKSSGKGSSKKAAPKASKASDEKPAAKKSAKSAATAAPAEAAPEEAGTPAAPADAEAETATDEASAAEEKSTSEEEKS